MPLELCGGCCILPFCPICHVAICDPCGIFGCIEQILHPCCYVHLPCCPLIACWAGTSAAVAAATVGTSTTTHSSHHQQPFSQSSSSKMNNTAKLPSFPFLSRRPSATNGSTNSSNGWWTLWYQDSSTDINSRAMLEQWLLWEVNDESYPYKEHGSNSGDDEQGQASSNDDNEQPQPQDHRKHSSSKLHRHHLQQKVSSIWKRSVEATAGAFSLDRSSSASSLPTGMFRKEEHYFVQPMSN